MKIWVGLVTPDEKLQKYFGDQKTAAVPKESLRRGYFAQKGVSVATAAYTPKGAYSASDLERFILRETEGVDCFIILVDERWEHLIDNCRSVCFSIRFQATTIRTNLQNFFHGLLSSAFRSYSHICHKFEKGWDAKLLGLPLRNFQAAELLEVARLINDAPLSHTLNNDLERQLVELRRRIRPRRKTDYKALYAVDDRNRFFVYGHEQHSSPETGNDHQPYCELAARFRFGYGLDSSRHYNVSQTEGDRTIVDGEFYNCHGVLKKERKTTHLNMFSSDMYY